MERWKKSLSRNYKLFVRVIFGEISGFILNFLSEKNGKVCFVFFNLKKTPLSFKYLPLTNVAPKIFRINYARGGLKEKKRQWFLLLFLSYSLPRPRCYSPCIILSKDKKLLGWGFYRYGVLDLSNFFKILVYNMTRVIFTDTSCLMNALFHTEEKKFWKFLLFFSVLLIFDTRSAIYA